MGGEEKKMEIDLSLKIDLQKEQEANQEAQDEEGNDPEETPDVKQSQDDEEDAVMAPAPGEMKDAVLVKELSLQDNMKAEEVLILFLFKNLATSIDPCLIFCFGVYAA